MRLSVGTDSLQTIKEENLFEMNYWWILFFLRSLTTRPLNSPILMFLPLLDRAIFS